MSCLLVLAMLFFGVGFVVVPGWNVPLIDKAVSYLVLLAIEVCLGFLAVRTAKMSLVEATSERTSREITPSASWSFTGTSMLLSGAFLVMAGAVYIKVDKELMFYSFEGGLLPFVALSLGGTLLFLAALFLAKGTKRAPTAQPYLWFFFLLPIGSLAVTVYLLLVWVYSL